MIGSVPGTVSALAVRCWRRCLLQGTLNMLTHDDYSDLNYILHLCPFGHKASGLVLISRIILSLQQRKRIDNRSMTKTSSARLL